MTKADVIFKIQALSSQIFNEYAEQVYAKNRAVIDGDLLTWVDKGRTHFGVYEAASKLVFLTETKGAEGAATFAVQKMGKGIAYDPKSMVAT